MRKKKWTPGDWLADVNQYHATLGCDELDVTEIYIKTGDYFVATTHGCLNKGDSISNAHLIAAAPDLLEALEGLIDEIDGDCESIGSSHQVRKARSAIAKAYGES